MQNYADTQTGQAVRDMPEGLKTAFKGKNPLDISQWTDLNEPTRIAQDYANSHPDDTASIEWAKKNLPFFKAPAPTGPPLPQSFTDMFVPPAPGPAPPAAPFDPNRPGGYAAGGPVKAGPAMLHDDEFVLSARARKYPLSFLQAINSGSLPAFDNGGYIDPLTGMPVQPGAAPGPGGFGPSPVAPNPMGGTGVNNILGAGLVRADRQRHQHRVGGHQCRRSKRQCLPNRQRRRRSGARAAVGAHERAGRAGPSRRGDERGSARDHPRHLGFGAGRRHPRPGSAGRGVQPMGQPNR
jgi:hypothetical protein